MKKLLTYSVSLILLFSAEVRAKSDTDVAIIKAEKVVIEKDVITIIGKARVAGHTLNKWPGSGGTSWRATTIDSADKATFVIKRPPLSYNDLDGTHAEEREKARKILDDAWEMSMTAAEELRAGREVGRIGFYKPDISIKGNLIDSIAGFGYLYPKGK